VENKPQRYSSKGQRSESENGCVNSLTLPICSEYGHSRFQRPKKALRIELQVLAIGHYSTCSQRSARRICEIAAPAIWVTMAEGKGEMVNHVLSLKKIWKGSLLPAFPWSKQVT